jgi:hypothetical protein
MDNFTSIRNGIREHIKAGKLNPFDLGVYVCLHLSVDWATGIYHGCALSIAFMFADPRLKGHIQQSLRRLRDRGYINYRKGKGARGGYPMLIHKYEPTAGKLCGTRLNAWKWGDLVQPEYEPLNGRATVKPLPCCGDATVMMPIQDLKTLDINTEDKNHLPPDSTIGFPNFLRIWNENCGRLPKLREMTTGRTQKLRVRCERKPSFEHDFTDAVRKAAQTPFLCGDNDRGWKANFDWLISTDTNHVAILEGKYDRKPTGSPQKGGAFFNTGEACRYEQGADITIRVG